MLPSINLAKLRPFEAYDMLGCWKISILVKVDHKHPAGGQILSTLLRNQFLPQSGQAGWSCDALDVLVVSLAGQACLLRVPASNVHLVSGGGI